MWNLTTLFSPLPFKLTADGNVIDIFTYQETLIVSTRSDIVASLARLILHRKDDFPKVSKN